MSKNPAIELKGISKAFGPVQANKDISIRVMPGTIHGIIGENGAGKSTLMSILYGFYKAEVMVSNKYGDKLQGNIWNMEYMKGQLHPDCDIYRMITSWKEIMK